MEESPFGYVMNLIAECVARAVPGQSAKDVSSTVEISRGIGDISCSIAFRLSKQLKANPVKIAEEIAGKFEKIDYVSKITADGGYLNFHLDRPAFSSFAIRFADSIPDAGPISDIGNRKRVIIEYPSVNPNKPWHVGHLRNAILGDSIANLYEACGYLPEREDYIDDLGMQVTESLWGYMHLGDKPEGKFDTWLGTEYVKVHMKIEQDKDEMRKEISSLMKLIEQDGTYESKIAREISEACVLAQYVTAFNYNIYHDVLIWESDILANRLLDRSLVMLEQHNVATKPKDGEYKGCTVIDLQHVKELPKELQGLKETIKVLIRSDGTPTYVAKDIAFHMWKFGLLEDTFTYYTFVDKQPNGKPLHSTGNKGEKIPFGHVDRAINIIDVKQSFEQSILKLAFSLMGKNEVAENIIHMPYGRVEIEGASLSGRLGTWEGYTADLLLEEAKAKAAMLIGSRFRIDENEKQRIAGAVSLSAIRFEFLKFSPEKQILFSWNRALNFEGNSGPYCQYMYARAKRLISDSGIKDVNHLSIDYTILSDEKEFELIKIIARLRDTVEKACVEMRPNALAEYAIELALSFSSFYESSPILKGSKEKEKLARLALVAAFAIVMRKALMLLGIQVVDRM
jgi:arginyl-tRNA synthetase